MVLILSTGIVAQDKNHASDARKEASQRKKEERKKKIDRQFKAMDSLLIGRKFVLEAHYLKSRSGSPIPVTSTLNFISIDSLAAVIQIGSTQRVGYNGAGGVTVRGKIINWKYERDEKKKNFYLLISVQANSDIYDINMNIEYSAHTSATVNGIRAGQLTFEGDILPKSESSIFKGISF